MDRTLKTTDLGSYGGKRHAVLIKDRPSQGTTIKARQFEFLQEVVGQGFYNGLLNCGPIPFETFVMRHDGTCWTIELEAVEIMENT